MANQKAASLTIGVPGVELAIWYNDVNLRIGNVEWVVTPSGIVAQLWVWDTNISATVPVIDRTEGQGSGAESVPGNYQMVQVVDPEVGPVVEFPPNIRFVFNTRTV